MNKSIITKEQNLNKILRQLFDFYRNNNRILIKELYKSGYSEAQVGRLLRVSRQAINFNYNKAKLLEKEVKNP